MRRTVVVAAMLLLPSCAGFKKVNIFTVPQEMAIGEVFSSQVESVYPILRDPRVDWYLNHRGRQLVALSDRPELPYSFGVVDSPELNAFAIPGGHIYLNLGMIESCSNESELLGIVAHEIGHVVARHSMKTLSQSSIVSIVGSIALNQYPNQWAALAANLFGSAGFLKLSRDAEREADAIGFEILVRAGYDPDGMASVFENLLKKYDQQPGLLDKLFSTHPPTRERIDTIRGMVAARASAPNLIRTSAPFQEMYDHVVRDYYSESGRRRWKEELEVKSDEAKRERDRLPWDKKSDEEKAKEKAKAEAKAQEKRDKERAKTGAPPAPEATPTPPAENQPKPFVAGVPARQGGRR